MPQFRHPLLALAVLIPFITGPATAETFSEDFSTSTYEDLVNTTADWNTGLGQLQLVPFALGQVGAYNTPGNAFGVAVDGDVAYIADQLSGLTVVNISNPANPTQLANVDTPGSALGIAVAGDHVYLCDSATGVLVFDVSDPSAPAQIGSYNTPGFASRIHIAGDYAYVADYSGDLQILDISNPAVPTLAGSYTSTPDNVNDIFVAGNYAFLADGNFGIQVVNVSDPTTPAFAAFLDTPGQALGLDVAGDHLFVADAGTGMLVFDISDPTSPTQVGGVNTSGTARDVFVAGTRAYVADHGNGIQIIDISNPASPSLFDSFNTTGNARHLVVDGLHAFIAGDSSGLQIVQTSAPANPVLLGSIVDPDASSYDVAIAGDIAYVASGNDGIESFDISDPTNPTLLDSYNTISFAHGVAVDGDYAYVADGAAGLQVIDISDPTSMGLVGFSLSSGFAYAVAIHGDYAIMAEGDAGVRILDISDPTSPTFVGSHVPAEVQARDIEVSGDHAFIANGSKGILRIDISDPVNPVHVFSATWVSEFAQGVAISGNHAYVAFGGAGVRSFSIENPNTISNDDVVQTSNSASDIVISGNYAFVADGGPEMTILDISDPSNMALALALSTLGETRAIAVDGNHVFTANGEGVGLQIMQVFQEDVLEPSGVGRSLPFYDDVLRDVVRARVSPSASTGVAWSLGTSNDGFTAFTPGTWGAFDSPRSSIEFQADLNWTPSLNPVVSNLIIDYLFEAGDITQVSDIPNDQGRQVRVQWTRSGFDFVGDPNQIIEYAVYRRVEPNLKGPSITLDKSIFSIAAYEHAASKQSLGWDFLMTVPVRVQDSYSVVVPTLADSTIAAGPHFSTFMVSALTATPGVFFDSLPDSGYSVDNLAPAVPQNFAADYSEAGAGLDWDNAPEVDLQFYRVYRGVVLDFAPAPANLLEEVAVSEFTDSTASPWNYYYKVSAVDFSGNESSAAATGAVTAVPGRGAGRFALYPSTPNPFNPSTVLAFEMASAGPAGLRIFDLAGRLVRSLVDGHRKAGRHEVRWNGTDAAGRGVSSGVYLYRFEAGGTVLTRRVTLLK